MEQKSLSSAETLKPTPATPVPFPPPPSPYPLLTHPSRARTVNPSRRKTATWSQRRVAQALGDFHCEGGRVGGRRHAPSG